MEMRKVLVYTILIVGSACSALQEKQKSNVNEIIKSQEIRKLSTTDLLIAGEALGKKIEESIMSKLELVCDIALVTDSISRQFNVNAAYGVTIDDFSIDEASELFEAYLFAQMNGQILSSSIQEMPTRGYLYTIPVSIQDTRYSHCGYESPLLMYAIVLDNKIIISSLDE